MANSTERSALAAAILVVYKDALTLLLFVSHGIKPTPYWTNSCDWLVTFQFCWKIPSEWEGGQTYLNNFIVQCLLFPSLTTSHLLSFTHVYLSLCAPSSNLSALL